MLVGANTSCELWSVQLDIQSDKIAKAYIIEPRNENNLTVVDDGKLKILFFTTYSKNSPQITISGHQMG